MCDTYQFRFGCDEKQLSRIFKDPEISKTFENAFMENYWLILNRIREYKGFLQSKNIPNKDGTLPFKFDDLDEDIIIQNFKQRLQVHIFHLAIDDVFSSKLDIKDNILKRLNTNFIKTNILGERLLCSFNELVSVLDPDTGVYYTSDILEDLIFEFLQM
mgnify:FL=1